MTVHTGWGLVSEQTFCSQLNRQSSDQIEYLSTPPRDPSCAAYCPDEHEQR